MSKIINYWGLGRELGNISSHSEAISFLSCRCPNAEFIFTNAFIVGESGELLGRHVWSEELIRASRGHFNVTNVRAPYGPPINKPNKEVPPSTLV
jgi:hypothetical protein